MKLVAVIVAGAISSENVTLIAVPVGTPGVIAGVVVTGVVRVTLGRVVSGTAPVVKVKTKLLANARPVVSVAPVVIVAVQIVLAGRLAIGAKDATRVAAA